jgi:hypothetical protein
MEKATDITSSLDLWLVRTPLLNINWRNFEEIKKKEKNTNHFNRVMFSLHLRHYK